MKLTTSIAKNLSPLYFFSNGVKDISVTQELYKLQSRMIKADHLRKEIKHWAERFPSNYSTAVMPNGDLFQYEDSTAIFYREEKIPQLQKELEETNKEIEDLVEKLNPYYEKIEP